MQRVHVANRLSSLGYASDGNYAEPLLRKMPPLCTAAASCTAKRSTLLYCLHLFICAFFFNLLLPLKVLTFFVRINCYITFTVVCERGVACFHSKIFTSRTALETCSKLFFVFCFARFVPGILFRRPWPGEETLTLCVTQSVYFMSTIIMLMVAVFSL